VGHLNSVKSAAHRARPIIFLSPRWGFLVVRIRPTSLRCGLHSIAASRLTYSDDLRRLRCKCLSASLQMLNVSNSWRSSSPELVLGGVVLCHPLTIAAAGHTAHPVFMFKIPANSFFQAAFKRFLRMPVELALDFARIHCIAAVVAGTVFDECDELVVRNNRIIRTHLVKQFANRIHDLKILFLASTSDIVGFAHAAPSEHGANRAAMVFHIEPVTHILTVPVDR